MLKTVKYAAVAIICLLVGITLAAVVERWVIPNTGTIVNAEYFDIYIDDTLWANNTAIDWGTVNPGQSYFVVLNCTNIATVPATAVVTAPTLPSTLTLTWTPNNTVIPVGQSVEGDLILSVDAAAIEEPFSFSIYVNADDGT